MMSSPVVLVAGVVEVALVLPQALLGVVDRGVVVELAFAKASAPLILGLRKS